MRIGYVRSVQLLEPPFTQVTQLLAVGCQALYVETSSGDHLERPVLHRAMDGLQAGDMFIVGDRDRLSRNDLQLDVLTGRIQRRGATLHLLDSDDALLDVSPDGVPVPHTAMLER